MKIFYWVLIDTGILVYVFYLYYVNIFTFNSDKANEVINSFEKKNLFDKKKLLKECDNKLFIKITIYMLIGLFLNIVLLIIDNIVSDGGNKEILVFSFCFYLAIPFIISKSEKKVHATIEDSIELMIKAIEEKNKQKIKEEKEACKKIEEKARAKAKAKAKKLLKEKKIKQENEEKERIKQANEKAKTNELDLILNKLNDL